MPLPEIKTRQHKGQPVVNTAQRQMQRNFIRSRAEQAAHRQSEQSDSPSNYAEEKVSRTAEDAVREAGSLARESVRTLRQRGDTSESRYNAPTSESSPAGSAATEYSGNPAVRRQIAETAHRQGQVRQTAVKSPEPQSRVVQAPRPIRTREQQEAVSSAVESTASPAQQQAARKAAAENIVRRKQEQKNALRSELAQNAGIPAGNPQNAASVPSYNIEALNPSPVQAPHNSGAVPDVSTKPGEIPIKKKSNVPIRTRRGAIPIKTPERTATKAADNTTRAFQEAKKATVAAAQKSAHAGATAGRRTAIAAKKAAELAAKLARSAAEAAKNLYAMIAAGGAASVLVIVVIVLIGCGAAIFGSQDESTETLPLSAEVEAYEPVIRKYAKQYGIPDYVLLIQAVMMQESGGRGNDPMQASECGYNTQYPRTPGGITDPEYSIAVGIQNLADCLQTAGAESPIDLDHIQLALQGYNFGSGYIT